MPLISEADLVLNPQQEIYHLSLKPEELADTVITVGDPQRVSLVSQYFDEIELKKAHREFVVHTGWLNKKRMTVLSTGMGTPNIDIVLNELDSLANIDLATRQPKAKLKSLTIIRMGTTGGLQADVPIGSYVVSSLTVAMDNLLQYYQRQPTQLEQQFEQAFSRYLQQHNINLSPVISEADAGLLAHFSQVCRPGLTLTCPGFFGPQGRMIRAPLAYPKLLGLVAAFKHQAGDMLNFEMESSAIYGLGRILNHRCLSTSVILANRMQNTFVSDADKVISSFIETMMAQLADLPVDDFGA